MISKNQIIEWIRTTAAVMEDNKAYLTELDSPIGDADHGINMNRGFKKVLEKLPSVLEEDIGKILKTIGLTLMSSVGGASGPLYGTFYMQAGMKLPEKEELTNDDLITLLEAGTEGVRKRGRPELGDKTMYDALHPALQALKEAVRNGDDTVTALKKCVAAAEKGMKDTIPMLAKKGRASYLGERSIGHQDPGATSTHLTLKSLVTVLDV